MDKQELSYHRYYDKPATSFCHQGAAWVSDIFATFIQGKITKLLITQQTLKLEKKFI
jgi:hypothetical protein